MLKIRTFILALSLFPILSLTLSLPSQAGSNSTSKGTAGSLSGAGASKGAAGSLSGGGSSKGGAGSLSGSGSTGLPLSVSPNVKILPNGLLVISQPIQIILNETGRITLLNFPGGNSSLIVLIFRGIPGVTNSNIQSLNTRWVSLGAPRGRVEALIKAMFGLCRFRSSRESSVPGLQLAQLPQETLVASTKAVKASLTIAQAADTQPSDNPMPIAEDQVTVDINQLNDAIIAYNDIVQESSPETRQKLSQDPEFVATGKALKELRASLNK